MINRGLVKARDSIVAYSKRLSRRVRTAPLEQAPVNFAINWEDFQQMLSTAADCMAHTRYLEWYHSVIGGLKRAHSEDAEYRPPAEEVRSSKENEGSGHPSERELRPCAQKFQKMRGG